MHYIEFIWEDANFTVRYDHSIALDS
jgi:hypothetical protein